MRKAYEAKGYYDVTIEQDPDLKSKPPVLHYNVTPGPRYIRKIGTVSAKKPPAWQHEPRRAANQKDAPVDADLILKDAQRLLTDIGKDACLLSLKVTPRLKLHSDTKTADVIFTINNGARANFGAPVISGNDNVHDGVILRTVAFKEGECFDRRKIEKSQSDLIQNQLFSAVTVTPATEPNEQGEVPVKIDVVERVPRTVRIGADFSTDQGAGVHFNWEHRNLWGNAEKLTSRLTLAQQEQSLKNNLRIPGFMRDDQTLSLISNIIREDTDAYMSYTFDNGATVERKLNKDWNAGLGVAYTLTHTEDELTGDNNYGLLSLPAFAEYNTRDSTLDPKRARMRALP